MKLRWGLLGLCCIAQIACAKDLGTWGDLYPVAEQDMLSLITQRLEQLQNSGQLKKEMDAFKERAIRHSQRPKPVDGIIEANAYTSRFFDPSVKLSQDIKDDKGRVFARKGEVLNPLKYVPFMETLYFINGDSPAQVKWMSEQKPTTLMSKIILVRGNIPTTSKLLNSRIYFDQNGVICKRLGITAVPAKVTPAPSKLRLHIETFPVKDIVR